MRLNYTQLTKDFFRRAALIYLSAFSLVSAKTFFVSPDGKNSNPGTFDEPFGSLSKGADEASAGDTVYLRGGTYPKKGEIKITKSGKSHTERICFFAYKKERPVFDFSGITSQSNGVTISKSKWLYFKGLEFCNVPQLKGKTPVCVFVTKSAHIIFDQCEFHHNGGTGLFIAYGTGGHLVRNCDSHNNYDPKSDQGDGQNADGFGVHYQDANTDTTIFTGCRGWWNSDDGIDCIHQNTAVIFENSWFWLNGYKPGKTERPLSGNGQGVKAGGYDLPPNRVPSKVPQNIVRNCVSFLNGSKGFNTNYHPVANYWYNNTAFNNKGGNYFMQGITYKGGSKYERTNRGILRNNLSFTGKDLLNGEGKDVDAEYNSWDLPGITVSSNDFVSIDTTGVFGPRKEDGSLPDVRFLKLAKGSDLIDKGEDVGLPFIGDAPDIGAFEFQPSTSVIFNKTKKSPGIISRYVSEDFLYDLSGRAVHPRRDKRTLRVLVRDKKVIEK